MVQCGFCGKSVPEAKNRNRVPRKYCSDRCRWNASNERSRKRYEAFLGELIALLKRYRYLK